MAVRALLEFRELIGRQRRIELVHRRRIGMTTRAKLHDPCAILLLDLSPAIPSRDRDPDQRPDRRRDNRRRKCRAGNERPRPPASDPCGMATRLGIGREKRIGGMVGGIAVAKDAIVLQNTSIFCGRNCSAEQNRQVLRARDRFLFHGWFSSAPELSLRPSKYVRCFRRNDRFAVFVLGRKHRSELRRWLYCVLISRQKRLSRSNKTGEDRQRLHVASPAARNHQIVATITMNAMTAETAPARR